MHKIKKYILIFFIICFSNAYSNDVKKDSVLKFLKTAVPDTNKVNSLNTLSRDYISTGEYITADSILRISIALSKQLNYRTGEIVALMNTGILYWYQDDYSTALEYYFQVLKYAEETDNKKMMARAYTNIGLTYSEQGDNIKALEYYEKALTVKEEIVGKRGKAIVFGNMGEIYKTSGNYEKALEYYLMASKKAKEAKEIGLIGLNEAAIGSIFEAKNDYPKALENYYIALELAEQIKDKVLISNISNSIGVIYIKQKKFKEAETFLKNALKLSTEIGDLGNKKNSHKVLSELYTLQNKWQLALQHYIDFTNTRDSIFNEDQTKKTVRNEMNFEFDKKQTAEKIEQAKKDAIALEELKHQKTQRNYFIFGFTLMLLLALFIFRGYRQKQKANIIIASQKEEVEKQRDLVAEKSKEITDSIMYAKRLQDAILPPENYINKFLPENFVLYKPKDIVAGDFYWMENKNNTTYIAVADCTGHGVPGAMVSVICSNALNRAVMEFGITEPGKILDKTRELVLETFSKSDKDVKDGMDISLCSIAASNEKDEIEVKWSGAYNPLWYISSGKLIELTADKQPIGKTDDSAPFTTHTIKLIKGDSLYLFTDGYADQFGGEKGKKFKYKPFKELINSSSNLLSSKQKIILEEAIDNWKGNLEQVDDICIIGIRL